MEEFSGMKSYEEFRNELGRLSSRDSVVKLVSFLEEEENRGPSEVIEAAQEILRLQADGQDHENEKKALYFLSKAYSQLGIINNVYSISDRSFRSGTLCLVNKNGLSTKTSLGLPTGISATITKPWKALSKL